MGPSPALRGEARGIRGSPGLGDLQSRWELTLRDRERSRISVHPGVAVGGARKLVAGWSGGRGPGAGRRGPGGSSEKRGADLYRRSHG